MPKSIFASSTTKKFTFGAAGAVCEGRIRVKVRNVGKTSHALALGSISRIGRGSRAVMRTSDALCLPLKRLITPPRA